MKTARTPDEARGRRQRRIRARLRGTAVRPRLSVFRSLRHLAVQLVDDDGARTLLGLTDRHLPQPLPRATGQSAGIARAYALGQLVAERTKAQGISTVVFDRSGYAYHGQVKAVAEGARAGGLKL